MVRAFLPFFKVSGTGSSNSCSPPKRDRTLIFLCLDRSPQPPKEPCVWGGGGKAPSPGREKPQAWGEKILLAPAGSNPRA